LLISRSSLPETIVHVQNPGKYELLARRLAANITSFSDGKRIVTELILKDLYFGRLHLPNIEQTEPP